MKKILIALVISVFLVSCEKEPGTLTGVVTYFHNEYQGHKPDISAKIFVTQDSTNLIEDALMVYQCKNFFDMIDSYASLKKDYLEMGDQYQSRADDVDKDIERLKETISRFDERFVQAAQDEELFKEYGRKAYNQMLDIRDSEKTGKATVDGAGHYSLDMAPGEYTIIAVSNNRKSPVHLLEIKGYISTKAITVESKKQSNNDFVFDIKY